MRIRLALPILALLPLLPGPARADVVYLANGRSFEDVIAEETASHVQIRMPGGELRLPKSQVARVEKGDSSFGEYLERRDALRRGGKARDWLGLAEWAYSRGLQQGTREAALKAAELDPSLAGLGPLLRPLGYAYDDELGHWIPYADSMRRRGFVQVGGQWLSREEIAERERQREDEAQRRAVRDAAEAAAAASRAQRALAELTLYREALRDEQPPPAPYYDPFYSGYPVAYYPGYFTPLPGHHNPKPGHGHGGHGSGGHRGHGGHGRFHGGNPLGYGQFLEGHQPGSIIPLRPRSSRSGH